MPTYEYECSKCGETFEILQSMKDTALTDCPNKACKGKKTLKRLIGAGSGFIFKGSGFYQTDYKKSGSGSGSSSPAKSESASSEKKSESGSSEKKSDSAAESKPKSGGCGCGGGGCGH